MPEQETKNLNQNQRVLANKFEADCDSLKESYGIGGLGPGIGPLYHYTSAVGLKGILETNVLFATHFEYLNDVSELKYGHDLLRSFVSEKAPYSILEDEDFDETNYNVDLAADALRATKAVFRHFVSNQKYFADIDSYITSFCGKDDLLSQWRGYGSQNGGGYCIGFEFKLNHMSYEDEPKMRQSTLLHAILYDRKQQQALLSDLWDLSYRLLLAGSPDGGYRKNLDSDPAFCYYRSFIVGKIYLIINSYKHEAFKQEEETRLFTSRSPGYPDVFVRESKGLLIPYVQVPIKKPDIKLVSIKIGPNLHPTKARRSVEMWRKKHSHSSVNVTESNIPLGG